MLPLRDDNPTSRRPLVTLVLIGLCIFVYFGVQPMAGTPEEAGFTFQRAAVPCELTRGRPLSVDEIETTLTSDDSTVCSSSPESRPGFPGKAIYLAVIYSMFLHGGLLHLGGNMLFLWIFGNNIEDRLGRVKYLLFYLAGGLAATLAHVAVEPASSVPIIGASGAIAAVMGAYLVLFPKAKVLTAFFVIFILIRRVPAWLLLALWFLSQFLIDDSEGIAWMAHVGGFVFGVAGGLLIRALRIGAPGPLQRSGLLDD